MKASDYITEFLVKQGVKDTFVLTGGCIVHMIDSIANNKDINYIPMQHEQAGAMAADAYARITQNVGVALTTSGPGATNLITGVCCSFYDSIPVVLITGQVPTSQLKRESLSRQIGFQETDVVSIFKSVTKYSKLIDDINMLRYELEKAFYIAKHGRPGPVLLDICDDLQRADIDPELLKGFEPSEEKSEGKNLDKNVETVIELINQAKRPIFIFGGGVRLSGARDLLIPVIKKCNIPYTLTWAGMDYLPNNNPMFTGGFGVTSGRPGNFAVQNSDLIIAIGTRLDTHEVGSNIKTFAREAKKVVVDIDPSEQEKYERFGMNVDLLITEDAKSFMQALIKSSDKVLSNSRADWFLWINKWKKNYPICLDEYRKQSSLVNPYHFMEILSKEVNDDANIITDCGSNLIWTMQGFEVKGSQRLISAFNHSPMGYSLPASIGAALAAKNKQTICITGDGGLQINIQELATIQRHKIDIKIFVLNNHGHGIIQGTQNSWLNRRHHAADPKDGGLPDPDFENIANAYGIPSISIDSHHGMKEKIKELLGASGPMLCNIHQLSGNQIAPKLLYGKPIEDADPLLPRDEFLSNMIIKTID